MYRKRLNVCCNFRQGFSMRIATWNINSVRFRKHHVLRFIEEQNIDVICFHEAL